MVFAFMFTLSSCGGNKNKNANQATVTASASAEQGTTNSLTLEGNDEMQFNKTELRVTAGQIVTLTLKHTGKMDKITMGHDFVLLRQGTDLAAFAHEAMNAKDSDYIPESLSASVIAHTKIIGGGESDTIQFTVAEKGTYDYICSFPGHFMMMKGKLIAE